MNYHLRYWLARLRNEFRQLTLQRIPEGDAVEEVMSKLKRDPGLRKLIEEKEAEMDAEDRASKGKGESRG